MKMRFFLCGLLTILLVEGIAFALFAQTKTTTSQDSVAINEVLQTIQNDWDDLADYSNHTSLDYVVLDSNGTLLYRTKPGLSESINAAIHHKDTMLDIVVDHAPVGKIIIYNNDALIFQSEKQTMMVVVFTIILLQYGICAGYYLYLHKTMIKPFHKMKQFAQRIADGNLDIPLTMDRQNLFGAFTESFDIMRSELKKARMAEARANESKKELVAKLSHDIKTPVASIQAASEVGAALSSDEKNRENYERIIRKADQINTLVTNLFSATLEELQMLTVTPSDMQSEQLHTLLENADYMHRAVIPSIPDCLIFADKLRLQQVFDNIFANSYKYADTAITLKVRLQDKYLMVCIEDYGGGVADSQLPLLKEKFKRGSNTKDIEGAGLGLYISDDCMKKMKGQLDIENGSTGLKVTVRIAISNRI